MSVFNPYRDASGDPEMRRRASRPYWRGWCRRCNQEKPHAGGTTPGTKGKTFAQNVNRGGIVRAFICADCLGKKP